jgi:hypothetical protein
MSEFVHELQGRFSTIDHFMAVSNPLTRTSDLEVEYDGTNPLQGIITYLTALGRKHVLDSIRSVSRGLNRCCTTLSESIAKLKQQAADQWTSCGLLNLEKSMISTLSCSTIKSNRSELFDD